MFSVEKVPLNCTSAIKSLLHASVNSLSTILQKVSAILVKAVISREALPLLQCNSEQNSGPV
jgi:hypothetical protein